MRTSSGGRSEVMHHTCWIGFCTILGSVWRKGTWYGLLELKVTSAFTSLVQNKLNKLRNAPKMEHFCTKID